MATARSATTAKSTKNMPRVLISVVHGIKTDPGLAGHRFSFKALPELTAGAYCSIHRPFGVLFR
jgi:hypothetical protein